MADMARIGMIARAPLGTASNNTDPSWPVSAERGKGRRFVELRGAQKEEGEIVKEHGSDHNRLDHEHSMVWMC